MKTLVLGLGNDLLGDDGVGVLIARTLAARLNGQVKIVESSVSGIGLLDVLAGYDRAIIIDALVTADSTPGTIVELCPDDLRAITNPSPHFTGLPEMIAIAGQLQLDFPRDLRLFGIVIRDGLTVGAPLSDPVSRAVGPAATLIEHVIQSWKEHSAHEILPDWSTIDRAL
jgi:hydrogenase maturation protease